MGRFGRLNSQTRLGLALWLVGAVMVGCGVLSGSDLRRLADRTWPIMVFVAAITVVAEFCAAVGVFEVIAARLVGWCRGRALGLWLLCGALATLCTVFLSLDTTAVLLTPVVVAMALRIGAEPLPFALTTLWLANTGSLLLPVSNLTNLLAAERLGGVAPTVFAGAMWPLQLVGVLVPMAVVYVVFFARGAPTTGAAAAGHWRPAANDDPILTSASMVVLAVLAVALVSGVSVWIPALTAAVVLVALGLTRRRDLVRPSMVPWSLVLFTTGLFLVVAGVSALLGPATPVRLVGGAHGVPGTLRVAAAGAVAANLVNNLPAYLVLEPAVHGLHGVRALLLGVNAGPLITPWASLATLLWHERLSRMGVPISWVGFALLGGMVAVLTVTIGATIVG